MNKVILLGNLVADPQVKTSQNNKSVCEFRIAVRRNFRNQNGEYESDFLRCIAFSGTADFVGKYFTKGRRILVEGSIQTSSWDKDDGTKGYSTDIIVSSAEFVDKASDSAGNPPPAQPTAPKAKQDGYGKQMGFEPVEDDDQLPF